jgi:hypothetical protein
MITAKQTVLINQRVIAKQMVQLKPTIIAKLKV